MISFNEINLVYVHILVCIPQERSLNYIWLLVSFFAGCSSVN